VFLYIEIPTPPLYTSDYLSAAVAYYNGSPISSSSFLSLFLLELFSLVVMAPFVFPLVSVCFIPDYPAEIKGGLSSSGKEEKKLQTRTIPKSHSTFGENPKEK
jgi:hypothetical protein